MPDINDLMFGEKIAHGTPFRRSVEDDLLDLDRVVQIGVRTTGYEADDFDWPRRQGFRVIQAEEIWYKSLAPLMAEVREQMGDGPVYISFDIDAFDPAYAPGTRHDRAGRALVDAGHRTDPRLRRSEHRRLRPGRGFAALRPHRGNGQPGREHSVRDALRPAGRDAARLRPASSWSDGRERAPQRCWFEFIARARPSPTARASRGSPSGSRLRR